MKQGRRKVGRVTTDLPIEWGLTPRCEHHGKVTSLSRGGCLLQTEAIQPLFGKTIYMRIPLPEREWWEVRGEVLYYLREVGFGVEFNDLSDGDSATLNALMRHHREQPPDAASE